MLQLMMVRRTGVATSAAGLANVLKRLRALEEVPRLSAARWMHSYALRELDGGFGLACMFQADGAYVLRRHAVQADLPASDILPVVATRVVRNFAPTLVYLVRRRAFCCDTAELERRFSSAQRIAEEDMPREVSWLHSHVVHEVDGTLGSVCLYQGVEPGALREHAVRAGLPADEIVPVLGRIVFREDPLPPRPDSTRAVPA
jgi:hypothetical protein